MHRNISAAVRVAILTSLAFCFVDSTSFAGFRPSFWLDYCSWHATEVVVVQATLLPGAFRVMESWKGNLIAGNLVSIPELQPPIGAMDIGVYPKEFADVVKGGLNEQIPFQHRGSRMVLFLKKAPEESNGHWMPADLFGEMKTSAIWIEGGHLYAFQQPMNPGPSVLAPWDMNLDKMKGRVREICRTQLELVKATAIEDDAAKAEALKLYVRSDILEAQQLALGELGKSGPEALPQIRKMLSDPAFVHEGAALVKAFAEAGGESVGEELDRRLQEQLTFWQATAATLSVGWWNQDVTPHAPLRERYGQTLELVLALEHVRYRPASITAARLGNFWRSLPQLNDPSGLNEMANECDKLVAEFRKN